MVILVLWLLMGVLGMAAIGFATRRIAQIWKLPGVPYLTMFMGAITVYHVLITIVAFRAILLYTGSAVSLGAILLTIAQLIVTIPALAFAAFLLGLIGSPEEES